MPDANHPGFEDGHSHAPSLHFVNEAMETEQHELDEVSLTFGRYNNEPTVALYHGEDCLIFIPKHVLQTALEQGWDMECPHCRNEEHDAQL